MRGVGEKEEDGKGVVRPGIISEGAIVSCILHPCHTRLAQEVFYRTSNRAIDQLI